MQSTEVSGPPREESAARVGATRPQLIAVVLLAGLGLALLWFDARLLGRIVHDLLWGAFLLVILWRGTAALTPNSRDQRPKESDNLPPYTIVVALKDEAEVAPQLITHLARLDYPSDRLRGFIVLEPEDQATAAAFARCPRPPWLELLIAPPGSPRTKPRALNVALSRVREGLLTVYDAEDQPHQGQLREAAARFAAADGRLACLQAPLRIRTPPGASWLQRQFAGEYGALFEVVLPALARLGLPLPLGGTSNHFRVEALRAVGGWDAHNVTEDADLGFRLWRHGYNCGVLTLPTHETAPDRLRTWLPQRTRWLKGFMQTWGVHMRRPLGLGLRGLLALQLTVGVTIGSACLQALVVCWIGAILLTAAIQGVPPRAPPADLTLAALGWVTAAAGCLIGARRAGARYRLADALLGPAYWSLLTAAFLHAAYRLARQPFHWDKTPHRPDSASATPARRAGSAAVIPGPWLQGSLRPLRSSAPAAGRTTGSSTAAAGSSSKGMARKG